VFIPFTPFSLQGKLEFEVHWIAYQLQPLAPPEGVPKAVFMEQKFKGQAQYLMEKKQVRPLWGTGKGSKREVTGLREWGPISCNPHMTVKRKAGGGGGRQFGGWSP